MPVLINFINMVEITPEIKKLIENNIVALASVDKLGKPHNIAVLELKVVSENQIVITDNFMKETIKNIEENNHISLVVWNTDWKDIKNCYGYELRGTVEYFTTGKWKRFVKEMPENKGLPAKGAILVTISKIKKLA